MWHEFCSGKDSQAQVHFLVEKRSDIDRTYRCCFTRLSENESDVAAAFFDPLSGELEALEELISRIRTEIMLQ